MKQLENSKRQGAGSVADEASFNRVLSMECRRCERTGIPFALLLLEMHKVKDILGPSAMRAIALSLSGAMRETDIAGWYEEATRSEEHTSELQSRLHLVCRLLLEKKKNEHSPRCACEPRRQLKA